MVEPGQQAQGLGEAGESCGVGAELERHVADRRRAAHREEAAGRRLFVEREDPLKRLPQAPECPKRLGEHIAGQEEVQLVPGAIGERAELLGRGERLLPAALDPEHVREMEQRPRQRLVVAERANRRHCLHPPRSRADLVVDVCPRQKQASPHARIRGDVQRLFHVGLELVSARGEAVEPPGRRREPRVQCGVGIPCPTQGLAHVLRLARRRPHRRDVVQVVGALAALQECRDGLGVAPARRRLVARGA